MPRSNESSNRQVTPADPRLARIRSLAHWLDESIRIPGTRYRIGVDALIGLIPGVGDLAGGLLSGYLIWQSHRVGAPLGLKLRMLGYVIVEVVLGAIPLIGDLFDFGYKANLRIARALEAYLSGDR
ncbi:MAG: DUF4112 domain-containing protein [Xanthomonadales bacterium]|nr:DUF4112 domain-containing protein [Xanthomonadales bacterium]